MNASEKKIIYNLLKTASDNFYGYSSPDFSDDIMQEKIAQNQISEEKKFPAGEIVSNINEPVKTEKNTVEIQNSVSVKTEPEVSSYNCAEFEDLNEKIIKCKNCPENLKGAGKNLITASKLTRCLLLIVTLKKNSQQEQELLEKMLSAINLKNGKNCFITSLLKCIPRGIPEYTELESCKGFLEAEINRLKPDMILFAGQLSANLLTNENNTLQALRQKMNSYNNIPFTASYPPEAILKDALLKRPVWEDLKLIKSELSKIVPEYEKTL